jgi:hypothetical protein
VSADDGPTFGVALVAVFLSGFLASMISPFFFGFAVFGGLVAFTLIAGLVRAFAIRMILSLMGYEISYVGAVVATMAGAVVATGLRILFPQALAAPPLIPFVSLAGIPSLLLTTWLVQAGAGRPHRALPL